MSEFKSGDKVLAEVCVVGVARVQGEKRYIVTDNDKYAAETLAIKKDKVHIIPTKTYEDGLREAWDMAKRIVFYEKRGGFSTSQLEEIFGTSDFDDILDNHTAQEAVAKIAEWEKMREVQVGDVVRDLFKDRTAVVSYVYNYDSKCYVIFGDGSGGKYEKKDFVKTGRTIDITALLAQIGGAE